MRCGLETRVSVSSGNVETVGRFEVSSVQEPWAGQTGNAGHTPGDLLGGQRLRLCRSGQAFLQVFFRFTL